MAYSGFAPFGAGHWITDNEAHLLGFTANQIIISGEMPIICAAGAASEASIDLISSVGLHAPEQIFTFYDAHDYLALLNKMVEREMRIATQHVHPLNILSAENCLVHPNTLSYLNDKANLGNLVPLESTPQRRVLHLSEPILDCLETSFPCVLKVASLQSTGGGSQDIYICHNMDELTHARTVLHNSERLVLESWLPAERFLCLNYTVDKNAVVRYIGCTEIICDSKGAYQGNWLGTSVVPSKKCIALGEIIAKQGAEKGYRGYLGIDIAELPNDTVAAFDLNFRTCGSTSAIIVFNSTKEASGASTAKLRSWSYKGSFRSFIDSAHLAKRLGLIVPLASFDPQTHGFNQPAKISTLILGNTRKEVLQHEIELARMGWY